MTRIAMLSVHACPLAKLGGRDSGGMNVYVRELARELGRRGIEVDVFTRWREKDDPQIQSLGENARVVHIPSGPIGYWPKMDVYEHLDEFTQKVDEYVARERAGPTTSSTRITGSRPRSRGRSRRAGAFRACRCSTRSVW